MDLRDVIEAIEFENEDLSHYYNKEEKIIIYIENDKNWKYHNVKDENELEEWELELFKHVKDFKENPEKYIKLPSLEELSEEDMMKKFLESIGNTKDVAGLDVRKLKDVIEAENKLSEWFDYRENLEENIAKEWCMKNNIKLEN